MIFLFRKWEKFKDAANIKQAKAYIND